MARIEKLDVDLSTVRLVGTSWFKETVGLYFDGAYEKIYDGLLYSLLGKGLVKKKNGRLFTIVKP